MIVQVNLYEIRFLVYVCTAVCVRITITGSYLVKSPMVNFHFFFYLIIIKIRMQIGIHAWTSKLQIHNILIYWSYPLTGCWTCGYEKLNKIKCFAFCCVYCMNNNNKHWNYISTNLLSFTWSAYGNLKIYNIYQNTYSMYWKEFHWLGSKLLLSFTFPQVNKILYKIILYFKFITQSLSLVVDLKNLNLIINNLPNKISEETSKRSEHRLDLILLGLPCFVL